MYLATVTTSQGEEFSQGFDSYRETKRWAKAQIAVGNCDWIRVFVIDPVGRILDTIEG